MSSFRIVRYATQNIYRNISLSIMTILILILMLLSTNTLLVVRVLTTKAIQSINQQLDISVHFVPGAEEEKTVELQNYIGAFPEVSSVTYYDAEQVLEQFIENNQHKPEILASLEVLEQNPFGASLVVKAQNPEDYSKVIEALSVPEYEPIIQERDFSDTEFGISKITNITTQVERFTFILTAIFGIIAFIVIFNTIRVAIYTHRMEISIKKLVGASNWFVRGPYLVESLIFTLISLIISAGVIYGAIRVIEPEIAQIFRETNILTNYYTSNILELVTAQFGAVLLLTVVTSLLAMRRYLKV